MYFADSLTGWKTIPARKTTDGGVSWVNEVLPSGGGVLVSGILEFSKISKDTLWGVGGTYLFPNNQTRGIIYRTTNSGTNWSYQIPDTSIKISRYDFVDFADQLTGWVYRNSPTGIHTVTGGDSIFLSIQQISSEIPSDFVLHQNYPNPFNPVTRIRFDIPVTGDVKLMVYDILGKQVGVLVDERLLTGSYEYTFDASRLSSGVYFYTLRTDKAVLTKKMVLTK
jgi:hypothetical protein